MTSDTPDAIGRTPAPAWPRFVTAIRPRPRWHEARLFGLVAITLVVGSVSLGATTEGALVLANSGDLAIYLSALGGAHLAQVLAGRRTDHVLFPVVGLLGGISLLLMERLPQDLVTQQWFGQTGGPAQVPLVWRLLGIAIAPALSIVVRSDGWLRRYKYTWAAEGVGL